MAQRFTEISDSLRAFIEAQKLFFVGTADIDGQVNVSPKGSDCLRVLGPNRVVWLNLTGSGNETAAHLAAMNRITLMFCSFEAKPMILRLYGKGSAIHPRDAEWARLQGLFNERIGARQFVDVTVNQVQTSCGYQVPFFDYQGERDLLEKWAERKGREGIEAYWRDTNQLSLDGKPTGIE